MGIVLSGGTVVTAVDRYTADVRIEGETIAAIGNCIRRPEDKVISVEGCLLFPGGIDPHTHFDLEVGQTVTADDFASGTQAAILGGTTTVIDYATQSRGESLSAALANWHNKAQGKCFSDYGFHMAISDWNQSVCKEMSLMAEDGVPSFKFYMAYKGTMQVGDGVLLQAMDEARRCGALICLHCENGDIVDNLVKSALRQGSTGPGFHALSRPVAVEREAVARAVSLAEVAGCPVYVVHLSSGSALDSVIEARNRGVEVYGETCPQYLLLDESCYLSEGFEGAKYVMSPPLRSRENQERLWQGLGNGQVDTLATDHCSFNFKGQKELGRDNFSKIPNGIPGVETRLGLLYTYGVLSGRLSLNQFVYLTSTRPAQLFGLFPRKGTIAVGSDADIVVWDPEVKFKIDCKYLHHRVDYTPFQGFGQTGKPMHVFLRGMQVVRDAKLNYKDPIGVYLPRKQFRARKVVDLCSR